MHRRCADSMAHQMIKIIAELLQKWLSCVGSVRYSRTYVSIAFDSHRFTEFACVRT